MKTLSTLTLFCLLLVPYLGAQQDKPIRTFTPPEELISIDGETPFNKAISIFSNAFKRFQQKPLVYDGAETKPIGVHIPNMYWRDAFDLVMRVNNHWYLDTEDYVRVFPMNVPGGKDTLKLNASQAASTREVEISAIFFEANRSAMEQLGIDWNIINQTPTTRTEVGVTNVGLFNSNPNQPSGSTAEYGLKTTVGSTLSAANILTALKAIQSSNLGELIASPSITVRSNETGRIQVGQDFSIKQRDFSGNTTEQFYSAGTIIDVTPVILKKDTIEFVHLKINAERSSVVPDPISTIINKTSANTSVILMDQEETVVGGLYTNDVKQNRRGVPFLKDLPWWFFGLRYLFGYDEDEVTKKELIIILKARIMPSIEQRVANKLGEIQLGEQKTLQREWERIEGNRNGLLDQIEAAKANRK